MKNDKGGQMKDLDFDELHEAVNKLMVQAQKPKTKREPAKSVAKAVSRPSVKVAERPAKDEKPAKPAEKEAPKPTQEDETPVNITVRTKPAVKVLPKKRGMAMDVVQAAKPSAVAPPSARAARTAPTLQPTGPVTPEPPKPRETSVVPPAEAPAPAESNDVSDDMLASLNMQTDGDEQKKTLFEDEKPAASVFPDPLEVHGFTDDKVAIPEPTPVAPAADTTPVAAEHDPLLDDTDAQPAANDWHMPAASDEQKPPEPTPAAEPETQAKPAEIAPELPATPFVNTKVEKRPLGSFAAAPAPAPAQPTLTKTDNPVTPQSPAADDEKPEPAAIDTPATPAELKPEIVAVESAEADYAKAGWEKPQDDEPVGDLRHMSIPQQHHGHDKAPAKDERPVFDTKNYHPPLQPVATAKHHTGSKAGAILTVILIILLIAAGVGAYFVATGSIDLTSLL